MYVSVLQTGYRVPTYLLLKANIASSTNAPFNNYSKDIGMISKIMRPILSWQLKTCIFQSRALKCPILNRNLQIGYAAFFCFSIHEGDSSIE